MKVICPHCQQKGLITSSNVMNDAKTIRNLYCVCVNTQCGASFVYTLAYRHTNNPPISTTAQMALELVKRLSKEEKTALERAVFV